MTLDDVIGWAKCGATGPKMDSIIEGSSLSQEEIDYAISHEPNRFSNYPLARVPVEDGFIPDPNIILDENPIAGVLEPELKVPVETPVTAQPNEE
jgi:hypothetical protein